MQILQELKKQSQKRLIITVMHDIAMAAHYADNVILLKQGQLIAYGLAHNVLSPHQIEDIWKIKFQKTGGQWLVPSLS